MSGLKHPHLLPVALLRIIERNVYKVKLGNHSIRSEGATVAM